MTTFMRNGYNEGDIILVEGSLDVTNGMIEAIAREVVGAIKTDNKPEQVRLTVIFWRWHDYRNLLRDTLKKIDAGVTGINLNMVLAQTPARYVIQV